MLRDADTTRPLYPDECNIGMIHLLMLPKPVTVSKSAFGDGVRIHYDKSDYWEAAVTLEKQSGDRTRGLYFAHLPTGERLGVVVPNQDSRGSIRSMLLVYLHYVYTFEICPGMINSPGCPRPELNTENRHKRYEMDPATDHYLLYEMWHILSHGRCSYCIASNFVPEF